MRAGHGCVSALHVASCLLCVLVCVCVRVCARGCLIRDLLERQKRPTIEAKETYYRACVCVFARVGV
jgi:uncharacterized membrane protein YeiH